MSSKYACIALWGRELRSFPNYIHAEQLRAEADNAPLTAIYKDSSGIWKVLEDIENAPLRKELTLKLARIAARGLDHA